MNSLPRKEIDLILRGGTVLTMDPQMRILENQVIAIEDGRIIDICCPENANYHADKVLNTDGCIVMPGLINTHTHLPMTYFRGLADDLPLQTWLNDYIWPLEAKLLNRKFISQAALHGASEMIKNGITQIHDMYFDMPAIAEACSQAGLRAIIGEAVLDVRGNSEEVRASLGNKVLELRQRFADDPLLDFNLAPHSIYGCSEKNLEKCAEIAEKHGILLHMHLSETQKEVEDCIQEHGLRPVFYLQKVGILPLPALYAHGVWTNPEEIALMAQNPASIAICSDSNLKLASGILPLAEYLKQGVNLSFATDGVASNNNLDLLAEMDLTAKLHKAINADPAFLPAAKTLKIATLGGAQALGIAAKRGSLEIGKDADICVLDLNALECQPVYNPYSHVIYSLGSRHVRDVVINGEVVLENQALTRVNEDDIIAAAQDWKSHILKELS